MTDRIVKAEIIAFEPDCVGVYLDWQSGRKSAYAVASVTEGLGEFKRLGVSGTVKWKEAA
jgi:hypothetical protein